VTLRVALHKKLSGNHECPVKKLRRTWEGLNPAAPRGADAANGAVGVRVPGEYIMQERCAR
jgi:hypothetical protein